MNEKEIEERLLNKLLDEDLTKEEIAAIERKLKVVRSK